MDFFPIRGILQLSPVRLVTINTQERSDPMSDAARNINPTNPIPQITALSIAFPMNFESPTPDSPADPRRAPAKPTDQRPTHRHDAGK